MTPKQILEVIVRIEDAYDEPFDDDRKIRWKRALGDQDAGAISRALETWIGASDRWKAPSPRDLIHAAPTPATSSTTAEGDRPLFREGIVEGGEGNPQFVIRKEAPGCWSLMPFGQVAVSRRGEAA